VNGDRQGFQKSTFVKGDIVGQFVAEVSGVFHKTSQRTVDGRSGQELNIRAQVIFSAAAKIAITARNTRFDSDAIANFKMSNAFAKLFNYTRALVAQNEGTFNFEGTAFSVREVVNIRATNTNGGHSNNNITRTRLGIGYSLEFKVTQVLKNYGDVFFICHCDVV